MKEKTERLLRPYDPEKTENEIYAKWLLSGYFNPDNLPSDRKESFSISLPPPNVTGTLHIGHAAMLVIEDIIIRFERMRGKRALWLPGTDHAAIATQSKVESDIYKKEKLRRQDIGREELLKRIEAFASESHDTIVNQVKKMGASVDWSREAFTLDEKRTRAVYAAFKKMYEDGLIYRGERIVNWDPKLKTTVSDDEVEYREEKTNFYYLKYGPFTIGTARPETKFGDKYVVMHPDDSRYKKWTHGEKIELEWINGPITATIIKDKEIDMEFGTGVMTITPAHSAADFDIAERHGLDKEQIIDFHGILLPIAGEFAGRHISKARGEIVEKLKSKGLIEKIDNAYVHNIAVNSRGEGVIEPQISKQWFVDVNKKFKAKHSSLPWLKTGEEYTLKECMRLAVEKSSIKIIPGRFEKTYYHWIDNLHDWCISRQIWYGHRIPVWYKDEEIYCGDTPPEGSGWAQDEDTLDTWFSSGLWTFSTLGWPEEAEDLKRFHPTSVLETGYDILFFWVARMILMSVYLLGDVPFKTVYLHGLVRDGQGRKMSKSLGNIIDPIDMIKKYGADALRMSLIVGTAPGNDSKLSEDKIRGYKHFANKIWNMARFVVTNTSDLVEEIPLDNLGKKDKEVVTVWRDKLKEITSDLENFRFYLAGEKLYDYVWHTFADVVIEESKKGLAASGKEKQSTQSMLRLVFKEELSSLHPFMPFVTEAIWGIMGEKNLLMVEKWPAD